MRARLNVLTECSEEWNQYLGHWLALNRDKKTANDGQLCPDVIDEVLIYQTLIGTWPLNNGIADFKTRVHGFLTKAMRERKEHSFWADPNSAYEQATLQFFDQLLSDGAFMAEFLSVQQKIAFYGMYNSLTQLVLKCTCPGVPDFYQGNETWRFDLVDPDNRQRIDFIALNELCSDDPLPQLLTEWQNGKIKVNLVRQLLRIRSMHSLLFEKGDYLPLEVQGQAADHIIAFARHYQQQWILVIAVRWVSKLLDVNAAWATANIEAEDCLILPEAVTNVRSLFDGQVFTGHHLSLKQLLNHLPFNVLL